MSNGCADTKMHAAGEARNGSNGIFERKYEESSSSTVRTKKVSDGRTYTKRGWQLEEQQVVLSGITEHVEAAAEMGSLSGYQTAVHM